MISIDTRLGPVTGATRNGVSVFLGVPYAAPPVGPLRWKPPAPVPARSEALDATEFPNRCYQPGYPEALAGRQIPGDLSEDCLYLNIYTPAADSHDRPVMFWIHGGAYIQGSANEYDGSALAAENDVVVVAINYRLGAFGFFNLSPFGADYAGSASLGFQDQIAALTWVRDNIADYGGSPDNVTLFGESAGGGSVLALLAAPSAKGLFHKAIACSPGDLIGAPADGTADLEAGLGLSGDALLARLHALPADEIFKLHQSGVIASDARVDGVIIAEQPSRAIENNGTEGVPLIAGCNLDEGSFMADVFPPETRDAMPALFGVIIGNGDASIYLEHLARLVPEGTIRDQLVRVWYDLFRSSSLRTAQASSEAGVGGWLYSFNVPGSTPLGVAHGSDVAFTFNQINQQGAGLGGFHEPTAFNREVADKWSSTFAIFARTGDPNGAGLPDWPQYDASSRACLVVDENPHVEQDPDGEALRAAYGMR